MPYIGQLAHDAGNLIPRQPLNVATETVESVVVKMADIPSRVIKRAASSATASSRCAPNDKSAGCEKPEQSNSLTIPIVLATVIPLCIALVIFFFLHRRHLKRLREEDANDRHKSLDFGMGNLGAAQGKAGKSEKPGPEMVSLRDTHEEIRRAHGMSLDMNASNPYLLPPGLQASRESIHSLSRTMNPNDDRYRPATIFYPDGSQSPSLRQRGDDSSSFTGSSRRGYPMNESSQNLLRNAQRIDRSVPGTQRNSIDSSNTGTFSSVNGSQQPIPRKPSMPLPPPAERLSPIDQNTPMDFGFINASAPTVPEPAAAPSEPFQRRSPPPPASPAVQEEQPGQKSPPQTFAGLPSNPKPKRDVPRASSPITVPNVSPFVSHEDHLADKEPQLPSIEVDNINEMPEQHLRGQSFSPEVNYDNHDHWAAADEHAAQQYEQDNGYDPRRLTMGLRPLPPDDPTDNPEQRANRIRSFYKEYFDDSAPGPKAQRTEYYEDYPVDYATFDAPIYDPAGGQFITGQTPYAEPITRRAMTPPPQGPPRFRGGIPSSGSDGFRGFAGPRAYSTASGGFGPRQPQHQQPPKKKLPPPKPLAVLPTPHMLKDDTIIPIDFAPPQSYGQRLRGTPPDSPKGGFKPYAPLMRPHKALMSSFDDLAMLPSPHALRKSGTFTSLDFAAPPRFKDPENASDAGSIRSNRSGVSSRNLNAIRAGAFRLSRVPKEQVGTANDFAASLKPSWEMR